jgi:hypothetical protein
MREPPALPNQSREDNNTKSRKQIALRQSTPDRNRSQLDAGVERKVYFIVEAWLSGKDCEVRLQAETLTRLNYWPGLA